MSFSEEMDARLAATARAEQDRQAAAHSKQAELHTARIAFARRVAEAADYLRARGAKDARVVDITRGMRGFYRVNTVYPYSVIAVRGIAERDGQLLFGVQEVSQVRSLTRGLGKRDTVFNVAAVNVRRWLDLREGQLFLVESFEHDFYQDANDWLLGQTEAALRQLQQR